MKSFWGGFEKKANDKVFYHGSSNLFTELRAGSWVTPYKEDALVFGVPWSSGEVVSSSRGDGRPPSKLKFKKTPPRDGPLYLYEVRGDVVGTKTNTGAAYEWNRKTTRPVRVTLIKTVPSWHKELLVR